jgi:ornithine cyclodeaminase/alanine dehydrogenase-like protein (mu-crystallin family)
MAMPPLSSFIVTAVMLSASVVGCAAQPTNADAMQIIVKFQPEVTNPESRDILSDLSATAKAPVLYKRAMSGGAHVMIIDAKPAEAQEALKAIAKRKDVIFAEPDRKMKAE